MRFLALCLMLAATVGLAESKKDGESKETSKKKPTQGVDRKKYTAMYGIGAGTDAGDDKAVERCLSHWGSHPFNTDEQKKYRVMSSKVKVMGIGGDNQDKTVTSYPQLILVEPSVSVMSKAEYSLMNPNGWYCFKANVNVMSKTIIKAHCNSQIADSRSGATVLGKGDDSGKGGVTVLGKTKIERNCAKG